MRRNLYVFSWRHCKDGLKWNCQRVHCNLVVSCDELLLFLELYELTDQFSSSVTETPGSSNEAPAVPSRNNAPPANPTTAPPAQVDEDDEEFEKVDDDEDYHLPDASAPKPGMMVCRHFQKDIYCWWGTGGGTILDKPLRLVWYIHNTGGHNCVFGPTHSISDAQSSLASSLSRIPLYIY